MTRGSPIARRIMVALFLSMMAPMAGWYFLDAAVRPALLSIFVVSVVIFGANILYVRRTVLVPLDALAHRAREVERWSTPTEIDRKDEIGDLARALDASIRTLDQRAEEAIDFATGLSHELRTPLAAIRGAAEILSEDELDAADRKRFAANVLAESERLERLVLGVLDMERARRGDQDVNSTCDLFQVAASVVEIGGPLLARKALSTELEGRSIQVPIGPDRARRILLALLENAIKFSPAGGTIHLRVEGSERTVLASIEDDGPGISDELRDRIFDRGHVGKGTGTGLGLAIAKTLVESAGGRIFAEPGARGARLAIELPRSR